MGNQYFKEFFELLPTACSLHRILFDDNGTPFDYEFMDVNEAYERLMGLKATEVIGQRYSHVFSSNDWEDRAKCYAAFKNAVEKQKKVSRDIYFSWIDKWFNICVFPLNSFYVACSIMCIRNESSLENEQKIQNVIESTNVGTWEWNVQTGETIFNKRWAEIIGYTLEELQPININTWEKYVHPDDLVKSNEAIKRHFASETEFYDCESRMKHKKGHWVWIHDKGKVVEWSESGQPVRMFGTHTDITEKVKDEKRLKSDLAMKEKHIELMQLEGIGVSEFLDRSLAQVISFTKSKLGYIFLYDEEKEEFTLHSWSDTVLEECKIKNQSRLYYLGNVGLWGEVVRHRKPIIINDYNDPDTMKKGYPKGHVPIQNFISIPVFYNGRIVAVIGAANKETDYDEEDILNLNLLMNTVWPSVERIKTEELLKKERELFSTTLFSIAEGIIVTDIAGKITLMNQLAEQYTGWPKEEAYGEDLHVVFQTINIVTREKGLNLVKCVLDTGNNSYTPKNTGLISKNGTERYISGSAAGIISDNVKLSGVVVSFRDITKEYEQEKEIEGFLNINLDMLCVTDSKGNFYKVNRKFVETLGYKEEELEGKNLLSFVHEEDIKTTHDIYWEILGDKTKPGSSFTNRYRCKDGSYKYIEWHVQPSLGKFTYSSARDITEKKLVEEELRKIAIRDELTGLYNRRYLDTIIVKEMERSDSQDEPLSMAMLDLDYFKKVNDTWGHPVGDEMLKLIAQIISKVIRSSDILIRFGGEEFVVIMPQTSLEGAIGASEKIRKTIGKYYHLITGVQTVSIGVAERMKQESFKSWYKRVDEALYQAKQEGRNRVVASEEQARIPAASVRLEWRTQWESGNKKIDKQHQELIENSNHLIELSLEGKGYHEILPQLDLLLAHIVSHFDFEENVLEELGYPDHIEHAGLHKGLLMKALQLKELYKNGDIKSSAFFSFMVDDVILGHMLDSDTNFFSYTRKKDLIKEQS